MPLPIPTTPGADLDPAEIARSCAALFKEITGIANTKAGQDLSDETLLSAPLSSFDIDSLSTMEFIMAVEDRFRVELDENAVNQCKTLRQLTDLVVQAR